MAILSHTLLPLCLLFLNVKGYDAEGKRIEKHLDQSAMGLLLENAEAGEDGWRFVKDIRNDRVVRLSDKDLEVCFLPIHLHFSHPSFL